MNQHLPYSANDSGKLLGCSLCRRTAATVSRRYLYMASRMPCCILSCFGVLPVIVAILGLLLVTGFPRLETDLLSSEYLRTDGIVGDRLEALNAALESDKLERQGNQRRLGQANDMERFYEGWKVDIFYESAESPILRHSMLQRIASFESHLAALPSYQSLCRLTEWTAGNETCRGMRSAMRFLLGRRLPSANAKVSEIIDGRGPYPEGDWGPLTNLSATLSGLQQESFYSELGKAQYSRLWYFGKDFPNSKYMRSRLSFGTPLAGFEDAADRPEEQRSVYADFIANELYPFLSEASDDDLKIYYKGPVLTEHEVKTVVLNDAMIALISLGLVWLYMCAYTRAPILSFFSMLLVLVSFPCGTFLYCAFGHTTFPAVNFLVLFLLLGIGADNFFLLNDAWRQSGREQVDIFERLRQTLARAGKPILACGLTTAASFLANMFSAIRPLRWFGLFTGLCVLCNLFFYVVVFPSVLVLHTKITRRLCTVRQRESNGVGPVFSQTSSLSYVERFFREILAVCLYRCRIVLVLLGIVLFAGGLLVVWLRTEISKDAPTFFTPGTHNLADAPRMENNFDAQHSFVKEMEARSINICEGCTWSDQMSEGTWDLLPQSCQWVGPNCDIPPCSGLGQTLGTPCNARGTCEADGTCSCHPGFDGADCGEIAAMDCALGGWQSHTSCSAACGPGWLMEIRPIRAHGPNCPHELSAQRLRNSSCDLEDCTTTTGTTTTSTSSTSTTLPENQLVLGAMNSNECLFLSEPIDDAEECMLASNLLGFRWKNESEPNFPGGCYVRASSKDVYFNLLDGAPHSDSQLICTQNDDVVLGWEYKFEGIDYSSVMMDPGLEAAMVLAIKEGVLSGLPSGASWSETRDSIEVSLWPGSVIAVVEIVPPLGDIEMVDSSLKAGTLQMEQSVTSKVSAIPSLPLALEPGKTLGDILLSRTEVGAYIPITTTTTTTTTTSSTSTTSTKTMTTTNVTTSTTTAVTSTTTNSTTTSIVTTTTITTTAPPEGVTFTTTNTSTTSTISSTTTPTTITTTNTTTSRTSTTTHTTTSTNSSTITTTTHTTTTTNTTTITITTTTITATTTTTTNATTSAEVIVHSSTAAVASSPPTASGTAEAPVGAGSGAPAGGCMGVPVGTGGCIPVGTGTGTPVGPDTVVEPPTSTTSTTRTSTSTTSTSKTSTSTTSTSTTVAPYIQLIPVSMVDGSADIDSSSNLYGFRVILEGWSPPLIAGVPLMDKGSEMLKDNFAHFMDVSPDRISLWMYSPAAADGRRLSLDAPAELVLTVEKDCCNPPNMAKLQQAVTAGSFVYRLVQTDADLFSGLSDLSLATFVPYDESQGTTSTPSPVDVVYLEGSGSGRLDPGSLPDFKMAIVSVVFGLKSDINTGDTGYKEPVYDSSFNLSLLSTQAAIERTCNLVMNRSDHLAVRSAYCFLDGFKNYLRIKDIEYPIELLSEFYPLLRDYDKKSEKNLKSYVGFDYDAERVRWVRLRFVTKLANSLDAVAAWKWFSNWDAVINELKASENGPGVGNIFHTSPLWVRAETERSLVSSTLPCAAMSVAFAFIIVLISLGSGMLAIIVILCILLVIICLMAIMFGVLQWQFGSIEAVGLIVFVGLSVDYSLHIAESFSQTIGSTPLLRIQDTLGRTGGAILAASLSTSLAAFPIIFCTVKVFARFGEAFIINIQVSFFCSIVILSACLAVLGSGVRGSSLRLSPQTSDNPNSLPSTVIGIPVGARESSRGTVPKGQEDWDNSEEDVPKKGGSKVAVDADDESSSQGGVLIPPLHHVQGTVAPENPEITIGDVTSEEEIVIRIPTAIPDADGVIRTPTAASGHYEGGVNTPPLTVRTPRVTREGFVVNLDDIPSGNNPTEDCRLPPADYFRGRNKVPLSEK